MAKGGKGGKGGKSGRGGIVLLFPGQGAQAVGMGRDLAERFRKSREVFERADDALSLALSRVIFEGPAEALEPTDIQQPALLVASMAVFAALREVGAFEPDGRFARARWVAAGGLSLGEYTALLATGALTLEAAVRLVRRRGELMQQASRATRSGMSAVLGLDGSAVREVCRKAAAEIIGDGAKVEEAVVKVANFLGPDNVVIAGAEKALRRAEELARSGGARRTVRLRVAGAFHTDLMASAAEELGRALAETEFRVPEVPVIQGVSGKLVEDPEEIRAGLLKQVSSPLLWEDGVRACLERGAVEFVEIGPGRTLTNLARRIAPEARAVGVEDVVSLEAALAG